MDKLKLVKALVAFLTFLLVFGTLVLLGAVYKKTRRPADTEPVSYSLNQPSGSIVADYKIIGDEVYILVKNGGISDRIIIYSRRLDRTTTTINLN